MRMLRAAGIICVTVLGTAAPAYAASFTTLYAPSGAAEGAQPGNITATSTMLYALLEVNNMGLDSGSVLQIDPASGATKVLHAFTGPDGGVPFGLLHHGMTGTGTLFGTTLDGGLGYPDNGGLGVLYRLNPQTGKEEALYKFSGRSDGLNPDYPVFGASMIYGTLLSNGANYPRGAIFSYDLVKKVEKVLYSFTGGADGQQPANPLLLTGKLIGVAAAGGSAGYGTLFEIALATGQEATLYTFQGMTDGGTPGALISNGVHTLYGTTTATIGSVSGTLFSVNLDTGAFTTLHRFDAAEGGQPSGLVHVGAFIYGICATDGLHKAGSLFRYAVASGALRVLYQFTGAQDGDMPNSLAYMNGALYGTTIYGGVPPGGGTVFRFTLGDTTPD